jgi:hypothetical protein
MNRFLLLIARPSGPGAPNSQQAGTAKAKDGLQTPGPWSIHGNEMKLRWLTQLES